MLAWARVALGRHRWIEVALGFLAGSVTGVFSRGCPDAPSLTAGSIIVLTRLSAAPPPVPPGPVLLAAALYAPIGIVPVLPAGAVTYEITALGTAYVLLVYGLSTAWFARRQGAAWTERTARYAAAAAAAGALASLGVTMLARAAGLEQAFPSGAMSLAIAECWSCEPPSDSAVRLIWYYLRFVVAATLLSPIAGLGARSIGWRVRGAAPAR